MEIRDAINFLALPALFYWRVVRTGQYMRFAQKLLQFVIWAAPSFIMMFAIETENNAQKDVKLAMLVTSTICAMGMIGAPLEFSTLRQLIQHLVIGHVIMSLVTVALLYFVSDDGVHGISKEHWHELGRVPVLVTAYVAKAPWNSREIFQGLKEFASSFWDYMMTDEATKLAAEREMDVPTPVLSAPSVWV